MRTIENQKQALDVLEDKISQRYRESIINKALKKGPKLHFDENYEDNVIKISHSDYTSNNSKNIEESDYIVKLQEFNEQNTVTSYTLSVEGIIQGETHNESDCSFNDVINILDKYGELDYKYR